MAHLYIESLPDQIIPDEMREDMVTTRLCYTPILSVNQTEEPEGNAVMMIGQTCAAYRVVLLKFDKQRGKITGEIDRMVRTIANLMGMQEFPDRLRRDAPLDIVSTIGKSLFGLAKQSDLARIAVFAVTLQQQLNATGTLMIRNKDRFESALKIQSDRISNTVQHVAENQKSLSKLVEHMKGLNRNIERQVMLIEGEYDAA